ncbi:MAG TPA: sarcosine oxidase subunit alpha family protein [Segeticoccus sp.]|uniref:sarcosine oxidase subunit alpha family protein n=1 Tax=Segeticoccus sp. TaxID=2706531 RepID=UPI002D7F3AF9|nr:sarcosine oxidase subunit alpha family protein [Segeticoccus sp.]HET8601909.1 sarcosine oxidase subunit alpha family protein [Segeticoccus sp.]
MNAPFRLPHGGRVDRDAPLTFTFDGTHYTGYAGDTLASALLANGVHQTGTSIKFGRPRGIFAAGPEDPNALVQIEEPFPEPMLTATTVELYDGLVASRLPAQGRLADRPDPARYDALHHHCEVLVIGAGPAGLAAALTAARAGARVALVDEKPEAGGHLLGTTDRLDGAPAIDWVATATAELASYPDVLHLQRTTAFGFYDDGFVLALEKRTDHLGAAADPDEPRQRVWRIRAQHVVVAAGAHERPVVFAGNDRPGTMLAGSARTYLHRFGVLPGREVVVFTTNDSAYAAAVELSDAGAHVVVVDSRPQAPSRWLAECERRGVEVRPGHVVCGTSGVDHVSRAHVAPYDGTALGARDGIPCDLLLVSGGWNPAVHLFSQARGRLSYDAQLGAFVPGEQLDAVSVVGAAAGTFELAQTLADGARAAAAAVGRGSEIDVELPTVEESARQELPGAVLWAVPDADEGTGPCTRFVDLQRDATVADVFRATGAGLRSVEHVKRYTTIGTAMDQGKTSGVITSGIVAEALGVDVADLGVTTFRPPYTPVPFAALAGRNRGQLLDPVRVTSTHDWAAANGAEFENVGQWKRSWFFPQEGEDLEAAVARECRAAREGVAIMDGSTLGKIDVQGPDAAELLDRLYTNMMSSLKVGRARYGVMCGADGMVVDDGTVLRLDEEHFLLTTTTGNAAMVLEWMEEWLQTEWPELTVHLTSVTEHWATFPVVGPRSRDVIAAVAPDLDVSNEAFPFMTWRDTTLAGVPARVARISFSGELAFEVNVASWYGFAVWEALVAAGSPLGITPYGTETMHVLRAEKGFPIIGQDTDGTVTPQDLGMHWVVSKKKEEFVGKRSFDRLENQRTDRKQLVGLLPQDPSRLLPEGGQLVATTDLPEPPVPMLGHVTSSYRSEALGRTFALALVRSGRDRVGETLYVPLGDELVPVTVTDSVLYDKEGARRDG